jgi:muramidase (phage lysozyme)
MARLKDLSANAAAFLDMVAHSELGFLLSIPQADDGYRVVVGSTVKAPILFDSYADHPRHKIWIPRLKVYSTAAGRYQIIKNVWDWVQKLLNLPDFGPESQDRAGIQLVKNRKALDLVEAGKIEEAIYACNLEWASLPGDRYGQGANPMEGLLSAYKASGGRVA